MFVRSLVINLFSPSLQGVYIYLLNLGSQSKPYTDTCDSSLGVTKCSDSILTGKNRYLWMDLNAGPVDYRPAALSGDGVLPRDEGFVLLHMVLHRLHKGTPCSSRYRDHGFLLPDEVYESFDKQKNGRFQMNSLIYLCIFVQYARESTTVLYYTKVQLGSPPKEYYVQIDAGSDVFIGQLQLMQWLPYIKWTPRDLTISDRAVDGIFGFGQQGLSIFAQLSSQGISPDSFSHCRVGSDSESNSVNGQTLAIDPSTFTISDNQGGTIIDSGTTLAYLAEESYNGGCSMSVNVSSNSSGGRSEVVNAGQIGGSSSLRTSHYNLIPILILAVIFSL
ncbi:hypothetical protein L6452_02582 [Arctium lappa]|uniref:Uncharacterized protein n=1 Tax=Arctium lappa TaxID=4217 RepID=A0ACB9FKF5_ARCLA|nr:hypothetical protein L6452_02582 [Arctium lappa]